MYQFVPDKSYSDIGIYLYSQKVQIVANFVYLDSTVNMTNNLDDRISLWIKKTSNALKKKKN